MMNLNNYGMLTGRLAKDPLVFDNKDGSRKVKLTLAVQNNYRNSKTGEHEAQFIPLEAFIPSGKTLGAYDYMHKGDKITVQYAVKATHYTDVSSNEIYAVVLQIENVRLDETRTNTETKTTTQKRRTRK